MRAYAIIDGLKLRDTEPEFYDERAERWQPRTQAFALQYLGPDGHWRDVRFFERKVQAWNLVRTLPGMPGAEPPPSQESTA